MRFRFIGQYTNGHTGINANGIDFVGHEPAEVTDKGAIASLTRHPEFEAIEDEPVPEAPEDDASDALREIQAIASASVKRARKRRGAAK